MINCGETQEDCAAGILFDGFKNLFYNLYLQSGSRPISNLKPNLQAETEPNRHLGYYRNSEESLPQLPHECKVLSDSKIW